ncbi:hypothetical protein KSS87_008847 [Heliosperma pusillum]|nr:hypothetical protein KSS87_008847 [Heliosperma pusillum]
MASTTTDIVPESLETLFTKIDEQKALLTKCTDLYKTLTNHFTNLHNSIDIKSQILDSQLLTLDSIFTESIDSLKKREDSIPDLLNSLSETVESRKSVAVSELSTPTLDEYAPLSGTLKSVCRRMHPELLTKLLVGKRRQSTPLRGMISEALAECVDSARFVVEAVREFVVMKREKRDGLSDKRLACTMVVGGMFPPAELKEGRAGTGGLRRVFSKKALERAEEVLKEWRDVADGLVKECGGEGSGMGPSESAMFIEMALGFGLKDKFEEEFYKRLMVEFCDRRDMSKLAIPILGDKVADFIEELVKNGKEVEAIYFAFESGLTERFQPASLLKSFWRNYKNKSTDILTEGNNTPAATDEANTMEMASIKSIIKCVEDLKIEEQYPIESLKKRLNILQQAKADRKKGATAGYIKRQQASGARASGGLLPPRPNKIQKLSNHVSSAKPSPVSRNVGTYTYPTESTYYAPSSYDGTHIPASSGAVPGAVDQVGQQHYGVPGENVASAESGLGPSSYYGSQVAYASYDYGAAAATAAAPVYSHPSFPR